MKKQYKLLRWYPSLPVSWEISDTYSYNNESGFMSNYTKKTAMVIPRSDLHPDFWELIEEEKPKPLFTTEDGVEYYKLDFAIGFNIHNQSTIKHNDWREEDLNNFKIFAHKSNADEYIWRNKPLFSYHEIWKYAPYGSPLSIFEQLAKERSEE